MKLVVNYISNRDKKEELFSISNNVPSDNYPFEMKIKNRFSKKEMKKIILAMIQVYTDAPD